MTQFDEIFERSINPHDAAFKSAFQRKEVASAFFRRYFPESIANSIDFRSLKTANKSYVDEKLRDRHSDIVYQSRIRGKTGFLYILFEHQRTSDKWMIFRLLCYMVNLWKEFLDQNPKTDILPVIFPAVIYNGKARWNSPFYLKDLLGDYEDFLDYIPHFTYQLYDLADFEDEKLLMDESVAVSMVLYLMKHISDDDFGRIVEKAMTIQKRITDESNSLVMLEWFMRYAFYARDEEKDVLIDYFDRGIEDTRERRMAMSLAERIRHQGMEEGLEKGRTAIILRLLQKRFGCASPIVEQKLRKSNPDTLDRFGESILDFKDLKDAEKWWETHGMEQ